MPLFYSRFRWVRFFIWRMFRETCKISKCLLFAVTLCSPCNFYSPLVCRSLFLLQDRCCLSSQSCPLIQRNTCTWSLRKSLSLIRTIKIPHYRQHLKGGRKYNISLISRCKRKQGRYLKCLISRNRERACYTRIVYKPSIRSFVSSIFHISISLHRRHMSRYCKRRSQELEKSGSLSWL